MRRALIVALAAVAAPSLVLGHYYFLKPYVDPAPVTTTTTGTPSAPTVVTQWRCVTAAGATISGGGPFSTKAAAETPCGAAVAAAAPSPTATHYIEESTITTTTVPTTTTVRTKRDAVWGGNTIKVADAHAQFLLVAGGGGTTPPGGGEAAFNWTCENVHTAASASQAAVNTAITAADDDDCVDVPAGTATWAGLDLQGKDIQLRGATVVTCSGTPGTDTWVCTNTGGTNTTITGNPEAIHVDLEARQRILGFVLNINVNGYVVNMRGNQDITKFFRVDHNVIHSNNGWQPIRVFGDSNAVHPQGVWDHNRLENGAAIHTNGTRFVFGDGDQQHVMWAKEPVIGGTNNERVFVESNYATTNVVDTVNMTDGNYAGRVTIRFNRTQGSMRTAFEFHSPQGDNRGYQSHETYHNAIVDIDVSDNCFQGMASIRGGTGVFFNNVMSGSVAGCNFDFLMDNVRSTWAVGEVIDGVRACDGGSPWDQNTGGQSGWRCRDQIGAAYDASQWDHSPVGAFNQVIKPLYIWGNLRGGSPAFATVDDFMRNTTHIQINRDYYDTSTATGSPQTVGVRVGAIANRPAGCTTGVAYWATDEADWNSLNGATPDGQLYKCESTNNWVLYYTPHRFPHEWAQ